MAIDWSLATQQPNILGNALQGYQAGQEARRVTQRRNALAAYAANPSGDLSAIIAQDPELAIQLQAQQRQDRVAEQTLRRQTETDNRERLGRQREASGQIFVALRRVAPAERQATLVQMIQQRPDVWSPEEAQAAAQAFSENKVELTDAQLDALAQGRGVDPNAGDFTIGSGRYRAGATTPYVRSQDPILTPFGIIPGAPATAPALSQEQIDKGMTAPPVAPATAAPGIAAAPAPGGAPSPGVAAAPGPASGGTATPPPPSSPPIALQDARGVVTSLGGHVTSGYRTPEANRRVRGVANSYHIRGEGQAVDIRPIPGMTFQQFRQHLIDRGLPITELINERDHWHWAFGQRGGNRRGGTIPRAPVNQTAPPPAPPPEGMDIGGGRRLIPMETPAQRLAAQEAARRARVDDARLGNDNRRLQLAEEEAARQGRPLTPQEQQQFPGAAYMNPNGTPGYPPASAAAANGGRARLSPQDSRELSAARTAARNARHMADLAGEFLTLNRANPTGMGRLVTGPINMASDGVRRMEAITNELTPLMRQGLPGAASDRDVQIFRGATVSITAPGETNRRIAEAAQAAARRVAAYAQFFEWYSQQNGDLRGAQEDWDAYADANPLFRSGPNGTIQTLPQQPWRQFFGAPERPRGGASRPAAPAARTTAQRPQAAPQRPARGRVRVFNPATGRLE